MKSYVAVSIYLLACCMCAYISLIKSIFYLTKQKLRTLLPCYMLRIFIGTELIFKGSIKRKLYQHSNIRYPVPIPNTNSTYNNFKIRKRQVILWAAQKRTANFKHIQFYKIIFLFSVLHKHTL